MSLIGHDNLISKGRRHENMIGHRRGQGGPIKDEDEDKHPSSRAVTTSSRIYFPYI